MDQDYNEYSIGQIDKLILSFQEQSKACHQVEGNNYNIGQFEEIILGYLCRKEELSSDVDSIFDESISNSARRLIGVCLLRIWSADATLIEEDISFLHRVIKLLDGLFDNNLYKAKELNIRSSDQTYEKTNKLRDYIRGLESKLNELNNYNIDSVTAIEGFKKLYLSSLRGTESKAILSYFLPKDANSVIDSVFTKVKNYLSAEADEKIKCFSMLREDIDRIRDSEHYNETFYGRTLIIGLLVKVQKLIEVDFYNSPYSKPADLDLKLINKKYPFSQTENEFRLGFLLSNSGKGHAFEANLVIEEVSGDVQIEFERYIGLIKFEETLVEFNCKMINAATDLIVTIRISWLDFDKRSKSIKREFLLDGQKSDFDWESLTYSEFYSTEAVDSEEELIGRREILSSLITRIEGKRVGSSFIYGQRRVGKSSIVKTLKTELEKLSPNDNIVFYQETGDYKDPNPNTTINQLATNICNKIRKFDQRLKNIPFPEFRGALSPISTYFEEVSEILPKCKILIILDEFDKIPVELYRKGEIGDSFFDTIRALSNKDRYGFLLVGGERMEYIMRDQSQEMNKFRSIRVDYFDKKTHWSDFKDLIVKPISKYFEVTDESITYLYSVTAGNPYFTKVICEELIQLMTERRDNHITKRDMEAAKIRAVDNAGEQIFAHFWKDGIRDLIENEEEITVNRRKLLIATANLKNNSGSMTEVNIIDQCVKLSLSESSAQSTLKEFLDRDVLIEDNGGIDFKVLFFKDWLLNGGVDKLKTTLVESDRLDFERVTNKLAEIKAEEIISLIKDWETYRGQEITTDKVRAWLDQFGVNKNQRIVFKILQNLHFYNDYEISTKLAQLFSSIKKSFISSGEVRRLVGADVTRKDIVVSYLEENPAKSGSEYAKLFADKNKIYYKNIVAPDKIERFLESNRSVHTIIFIDDFIGSGASSINNISRLVESHPSVFSNESLNFHYGVICGFQEGKHKILQRFKRLKINVEVHICDILDESDKVFHDSSKLFTAPGERNMARTICYDKGSTIEKNAPLGFGNTQSIIVFPRTVPNNSLPILWSNYKDWIPLFPRPM